MTETLSAPQGAPIITTPPHDVTTAELLGVKVGDVFVNSWGYDQTNIDFYKVIRITRTKVEVVPIGARYEGSTGTHDVLVPDPTVTREWDVILRVGVNESQTRTSKLCKLRAGYKGVPNIVLRSGEYSANRWEGRLSYQTGAGFGH